MFWYFVVNTKKFIVSTDIGQDIDDLFAIRFALATNTLAGVITTGSDPRLKAVYARKILDNYGADVPVFYGLKPPKLSSGYIQETAYGLVDPKQLQLSDQDLGISGEGIDFIIEEVTQGIRLPPFYIFLTSGIYVL